MRKKKLPNYVLIQKAPFIEKRYENFLRHKKFLEKYPSVEKHISLTDLDRIYDGMNKPMKDVVICDRCQQDVTEDHVVDVEKVFMYHRGCLREDEIAVLKNDLPELRFSNVIRLGFT